MILWLKGMHQGDGLPVVMLLTGATPMKFHSSTAAWLIIAIYCQENVTWQLRALLD